MPQRTEVAPPVRPAPSEPAAKPGRRRTKIGGRSARRVLTTVLAAILFSAAVIATLVYVVNSGAYQSTDDAFIDGHIVPVSAKVAGRVQSVYIRDNQTVTRGQTVVELDPRDFVAATRQKMAAMQSSEAQAAAARAAVQQAIAHVKTEQATVESDQATATADAAQNDKAQSDLQRYQDLYKTRVVAPQDLDQYRAAAKSAKATLDAANKKVSSDEALVNEARAEVEAYQGLVESVTAQIHEADANLSTARLNQSYADIVAPEDGWVTQKSVEAGEYVQAGQTMFALVPQNVWVTANFKEDQIRRMRPGQEVEIEIDALHGKKSRGHVDSIQAGSGARFSLLPPQNATGNYVKVVQRVPVKILFDEPINSGSDLPLGPGESVVPTVIVSSVDYSPVAVGIATVVIIVGAAFIMRRGLGSKRSAGGMND
jgi:membrane fusion protein, multidrug efflux system